MLQYLDRRFAVEKIIQASPVVFLLHDVEEILTIEQFWRENRYRLPIPEMLRDRIRITTAEMAAAVTCVFVLGCLASWPTTKSSEPDTRIEVYGTTLSIRLLNALAHLAGTLVLRRYTPGVITAVTVVLPYTLYTFHRLHRKKLLIEGALVRSVALGTLLHLPMVLGAQAAGKPLARLL
ncbi:hypothetical protein BH23ACT11_BH23ACT11_22740 [soil metagenome]